VEPEELRRHAVDHAVGALRREDGRDEELPGVRVVELAARPRDGAGKTPAQLAHARVDGGTTRARRSLLLPHHMDPERPSRNLLARVLLFTAASALAFGLLFPVVSVDRPARRPDSYSVLGGVYQLYQSDHWVLAFVVFAFSVAFPSAKLAMLGLVAFGLARDSADRTVRWLAVLGKWSMLDVFVVALLIPAVDLGILSDATPRYGLAFFGAGILLSMLCAATLSVHAPVPPGAARVRLSGCGPRLLSLTAAGLFVAGLGAPLLVVEKWIFWESRFSAASAIGELFGEGNSLLAAVLALFVVALPLTRFLAVLTARLKGTVSAGTYQRLLVIDEWAMLDVYCLALLVVALKVGDLAGVTPQRGLWLLSSAAALSFVDSWLLRASAAAPARAAS
jgi:paraquat-inducible protein A